MRNKLANVLLCSMCLVLILGFIPRNRISRSTVQIDTKGRFQYSTTFILSPHRSDIFDDNSRRLSSSRLTAKLSSQNVGRAALKLEKFLIQTRRAFIAIALVPAMIGSKVVSSAADDELAKFAAAGHSVSVDGNCFLTKCHSETVGCANDRTCLKGLSCLTRCKGGSMCSTGCFAKYGSPQLDGLLQCSVEKNDCVHVPGKENVGWSVDTTSDLPSKPLVTFNPATMQGVWYKTMGLDSRYDCFDCQKNTFSVRGDGILAMDALFRIPRPTFPGYLQNSIQEELHLADPEGDNHLAHMQSQGTMFGLTFWENWYVLGDTKRDVKSAPQTGLISSAYASESYKRKADLKLVFYTGHTLQGSYKGSFVYSRTHTLSPSDMEAAKKLITEAGMDPAKFCVIRNQCFLHDDVEGQEQGQGGDHDSSRSRTIRRSSATHLQTQSQAQGADTAKPKEQPNSFWNILHATEVVTGELADWFEDPAILSEWLVSQQVKMTPEQTAISPLPGLDGAVRETLDAK